MNIFRYSLKLVFLMLFTSSTWAALESNQWLVNAWGTVKPRADYKSNDASCGIKFGKNSASFTVSTRGNGDAELTLPGVLEPNKAYRFRVWLKSNKPTHVELFFRRDGFPYETTAIQSVNLSDWQLLDLKGIHVATGRGSVRLTIRDLNVGVCVNSAVLDSIQYSDVGVANGQVTNSAVVKDTYFGVHLNRLGVHNGWPNFDPGTLRLWDTGTTWALLQPKKAAIDWRGNIYAQRLDYFVQHGRKHHPKLQFIYTLGMTPAWAGSAHPNNCNHSGYGVSICTKPRDLEDWRNYVRAIGVRYKGGYKGVIKVWEVWNEADVWVHWDNKPEDMVPLVKIAYEELKKIDPANQIIGPNITGSGLKFISRFLDAGGGAYVDGISIHAYVGRSPELSFALIRNLKQMLSTHGLSNKPIWNTETNVSCNTVLEDCNAINANAKNAISGEDALAQGLIGNAALGVVNFTFYTWEGASMEFGGLPLVEKDFLTQTLAGRVMAVVKKWLMGSKLTFLEADNPDIKLVKVERDGSVAYILWSIRGNKQVDLNSYIGLNHYMMASDGLEQLLQAEHISIGSEPMLIYSSFFK